MIAVEDLSFHAWNHVIPFRVESRYLKHLSQWPYAFVRLFTAVRAVIWRLIELPAFFNQTRKMGQH